MYICVCGMSIGGLVDWCNVVSWMEVMNAACMCGYCGVY